MTAYALTGAMLFVFTTAWAWTVEQEAKLLPADGEGAYGFGDDVALDGETAVIGVLHDNVNGFASGSAYVFTRTAGVWTQQAKLLPADGATWDLFGGSVAVDGDTAVIGAFRDDDNGEDSGSAYVFERRGGVWTAQAKLLPADGMAGDRFGWDVALDGDTAVIGSYWDDDNGEDSGSAYVFTRTVGVWTEQAKLLATDGALEDHFGWAVALDGDTAVIGADRADGDGAAFGSAYVFTRIAGVWTEQAKLLATDGEFADRFGYSVELDGDTIVIGARSDDDNGPSSGSAYVFTGSAGVWEQQAKLLASDGAAEDYFGKAVALDGDTAIIGAQWDDDNGSASGSAYAFARTGEVWTEQAKLLPSDGATGDWFGHSVTINGDTAVIGAFYAEGNEEGGGAAYVFRLIEDDGGDGGVPAVTGTGGLLTLLAVAGIGIYFVRRGAH